MGGGMTHPLTPANCDLRDFRYMPVEFQRLLSSETWLMSTDSEKVAALTLWGNSWSQVPAGSVPSDDRLLAHLSGAGSKWKKVKAQAMRGWQLCADGRYYHPVVCEKALEAWLEKITQRHSGGAGNAKRWGADFDPKPLLDEIMSVRAMLESLNPKSRALTKKPPKELLQASQPESGGDAGNDRNPNRPPTSESIGLGSQGKGREGNQEQEQSLRSGDIPHDRETGTEAGQVCALLMRAGVLQVNPSHPELLAALASGITGAELADVAAQYPGKHLTYVVRTAVGRRKDAATHAAGAQHGNPPARPGRNLSAVDRVRLATDQHDDGETRGRVIDAGPAETG